jgi:hypothetical protein
MQVANRPYRPPKLGFIPPLPLRLERMGASFPLPVAPQSNMMEGFVSKGTTDAILMAIGGAGVTYFARFLPGVGEPLGVAGGLGLLGLGTYKFYNAVTGASEPSVESTSIPADQVPEDVYQLRAKILTPVKSGKAELSSMWTALFSAQRTFKISFSVTNIGQKPVTAQIEFRTQEFTRPLFGQPDTAEFSTNYLLNRIMPGETRLVNTWHPIEIFFTLPPIDVVASLILRASAVDPGRVVHTIDFTTQG